MHLALFLVFGAVCVAGAVNLLIQSHPIQSALSLIVVMASLAVEYLLLGAEFVAAVQVIVYAGAIMVLFVFVIMLLNAGEEERSAGSHIALFMGVPSFTAAWEFCWLGQSLIMRRTPCLLDHSKATRRPSAIFSSANICFPSRSRRS